MDKKICGMGLLIGLLLSQSLFAQTAVTDDTDTVTAATPATTTPATTTVTTTVTTEGGVISEADSNIISQIYDQYGKEPALLGTSLTATSQNGVVTISGNVTQQSQADQAIIAAKKVAGVKEVRSNIIVSTNPATNQQTSGANY
jgi:hypothetical protein